MKNHIKLTDILESVVNEIGENTAEPYDFRVKKEHKWDTVYEWKTDEEGEDPISYTMVITKWTEGPFSTRELNYDLDFGIDLEGGGTDYHATSRTRRTGNMRRVMATVIAALKQEIAKDNKKPGVHVRTIYISPSKEDETDQRRAKLYLSYTERNKPAGSTVSYDADRGSIEIKLPKPGSMKKKDINEAFDKPYPTRTVKSTDTIETQDFSTEGGQDYRIIYMEDSKDEWTVGFRNVGEDLEDPYGKTGTGNQMKVFATVLSSMAEFLRRRKPKTITFAADKSQSVGQSRERLYSTLIKRYAPAEYDVEESPENPNYTEFTLRRKEK